MNEDINQQTIRNTGIFDEDQKFLSNQPSIQIAEDDVQNSHNKIAIILGLVTILLIYFFFQSMKQQAQFRKIEDNLQDQINKIFRPQLQKINNQTTLQSNNNILSKSNRIFQNQNQISSKSKINEISSKTVMIETKNQQITKNIIQPKNKSPNILKKQIYPVSQEDYKNRIYAGQIHYSRIPVQYWQHRILMVKAMGLNTLSVYVMWNYHQTSQQKFDYQTQNKNLSKFLDLAAKHSMKVLLRPGPYICGQWDFGGLPARLLSIQELKIRSFNSVYLKQVYKYFKSLATIINPFLISSNGPIHMIQIENELGSLRSDKKYTWALVQMWKKLEINIQFYIQDASNLAIRNYFDGAAIGISDGSHNYDYQIIKQNKDIKNNTLVFGGQIYTGWMTHWGEEKWGGNPIQKFQRQIEYIFQNAKQFSLFMAHGGTNFGLTAGANAGMHGISYEPMITSYDYDATITQQGRETNKSKLIVKLMTKYVRSPSIKFPEAIQTIDIQQIHPVLRASLLQNLGQPILRQQKELYFFEHKKLGMYNQGIIVYETYLSKGKYNLKLIIHDFGIIFLDNIMIASHARLRSENFTTFVECQNIKCRLLILVQAMGHNNYGPNQQQDLKGLLKCDIMIPYDQKSIPKKEQATWNLYAINIDQKLFKMNKISKEQAKNPAIYHQTFNLTKKGDTYINMKNYKKGYVWINGRNLGRYWNIGPQQKLYCPGVWLKQKQNEIIILQLLHSKSQIIKGQKQPI